MSQVNPLAAADLAHSPREQVQTALAELGIQTQAVSWGSPVAPAVNLVKTAGTHAVTGSQISLSQGRPVPPAGLEPPTDEGVGLRSPITAPAEELDWRQTFNVEDAHRSLAPRVQRQSHPQALRLTLEAYANFLRAADSPVRKPYLYYVDYGLSSTVPRGYVFNMEQLSVVAGPFYVAHGTASGPANGVPTRFSNTPESHMSSLGMYSAGPTYQFNGRAGGRSYKAVGMVMRGRSGRFNSAAVQRRIVAHGAPYVTSSRAGRSHGCPAMPMELARERLPLVANGGTVFIFSPRDEDWLQDDPWFNRA